MKILYDTSKLLDVDDGYTRTNTIFDFIGECASGVAKELKSYEDHIKKGDFDFHRIRKHPEFGKRMERLYKRHGYDEMMAVLDWVKKEPDFRLGEMANLLVVADGRDGALPESVWESIRPLKKTGTDIGLVVNRWSGPMRAPAPAEETDIPVFLIPELPPEAFTALYRFVFGS